jgi:hypothetical protein
MSRRKCAPAPRASRATTIPARAAVERYEASFDCLSAAGLAYGTTWTRDRCGLTPQPSTILRHALMRWVHSLDRIESPEEVRSELRALQAAGKGTGSASWLAEVRARLAQQGTKSGGFRAVRYSAEELRQQRVLMETLEALS